MTSLLGWFRKSTAAQNGSATQASTVPGTAAQEPRENRADPSSTTNGRQDPSETQQISADALAQPASAPEPDDPVSSAEEGSIANGSASEAGEDEVCAYVVWRTG